MEPIYWILISVIVALPSGVWVGFIWRADHNMDLYLDEQHKRIQAEEDRDKLKRELALFGEALAKSQNMEVEKDIQIDHLLMEISDLTCALRAERMNRRALA